MLHYLQPLLPLEGYASQISDLPAVDYGLAGEPSFRGMLSYLNTAWLQHNLASGTGLTLSKLGGDGFAMDFDGVFKRDVAFDLDLASQLSGLGIELMGQAQVRGSVTAALDFDFSLDWTNGAQFAVNNLSFDGALAARWWGRHDCAHDCATVSNGLGAGGCDREQARRRG
jgi:hypothetical protein